MDCYLLGHFFEWCDNKLCMMEETKLANLFEKISFSEKNEKELVSLLKINLFVNKSRVMFQSKQTVLTFEEFVNKLKNGLCL